MDGKAYSTPLNDGWSYAPLWRDEWAMSPIEGGATVRLPHANLELPWSNFDEKCYQFVSAYQRRLERPKAPAGWRIFLDFEAAAQAALVYADGVLVASHKGGYLPFSAELTAAFAKRAEEVLVSVRLDSTEGGDFPPFGNVIDYLGYGGIYREVSLRAVPPAFIANIRALPRWAPGASGGAEASIDADLFLAGPVAEDARWRCRLRREGAVVAEASGMTGAGLGEEGRWSADGDALSRRLRVSFPPLPRGSILPWDLDSPFLYEFEAELLAADGTVSHAARTMIGFREARCEPDGFFLNGRKVVLRGLNRHQSWPHTGYAMPRRAQRRDAEILKSELALNCARTSHYPQSRHFLDACDELGLLVMEEIPGWQHIGGEAWKEAALEDIRGMIVRDWNRPSIFLWGTRINESRDDHALYASTAALAAALDPSRQRGGVRCITDSELLEDVYTFNDFVMGEGETALRFQAQVTGLGRKVPYLVTENNGHMFPTKRFDNEERLVEQATRHARVHNAAGLNGDTCGALSWCFADYNTHRQFGSGDRICYHGIMDMGRVPKPAAAFYASQRPRSEPFLEPLTTWASGERSVGGPFPVTVMTNCDEVELRLGGAPKGRFLPDRKKWAGLAHPPIVVSMPEWRFDWAWEDALFVGYTDGKPVAERRYSSVPVPVRLVALPDSDSLHAAREGGSWDVTRIVLRIEDQMGNLVPFADDPAKISVEGPGSLIGPSLVPLRGGCTAVWLRSGEATGMIRFSAATERFTSAELRIEIR